MTVREVMCGAKRHQSLQPPTSPSSGMRLVRPLDPHKHSPTQDTLNNKHKQHSCNPCHLLCACVHDSFSACGCVISGQTTPSAPHVRIACVPAIADVSRAEFEYRWNVGLQNVRLTSFVVPGYHGLWFGVAL